MHTCTGHDYSLTHPPWQCHCLNIPELSGPNVGPLELSDPYIEACARDFKFKLCPDLDRHDVISLVDGCGGNLKQHGLKLTTTFL